MKRFALRSESANADLCEIAFYIGVEAGRPEAADRVVEELVAACNRIAELQPMAVVGTSAPELGDGIRSLTHQRWVILFRYVDSEVHIMRIVDGSRDYPSWKPA